jgi:hypothetical protein
MAQTREAIAQNLAERLWWQAARRDDARVARRLYRQPGVDGVYQLDAGALLDDFCSFLQALGVGAWLGEGQGTAVQREMVPVVQYVLLYRLKTLCGIERRQALPAWRFSDEALRRLVGCNAHQVRHGVCQRGAAHRQGARTTGPICPAALADHLVKLHLRGLEALLHRVIRALAQAGVWAAQVTGIVDATDVETTAPYEGCGQVTRQRQITDTRGQVHAIAVTVYGWKLLGLIEARTKIPLAATVVPIQAHATRSLRAVITQARTHLAGHVRRHQGVFDNGCLAGVDLWWLAPHGITCVVPAKDQMAVTVDAQAPAAAGAGSTVGRRAQTVRHGQGKTAWRVRLATDVVGITGVTTDDQYGPPEPGRRHNRRDVQPTPINAVVVRQWHGRH